jgi:hypothetical protein
MSIVFHIDTLLLANAQSSHTVLYAPVARKLVPRLDAKYSLIRSGN